MTVRSSPDRNQLAWARAATPAPAESREEQGAGSREQGAGPATLTPATMGRGAGKLLAVLGWKWQEKWQMCTAKQTLTAGLLAVS